MDEKVEKHEVMCMFIGYTNNHTGNCYRMWNPNTEQVSKTRDIIFLHKMFYQDKCKENTKLNQQIMIQVRQMRWLRICHLRQRK